MIPQPFCGNTPVLLQESSPSLEAGTKAGHKVILVNLHRSLLFFMIYIHQHLLQRFPLYTIMLCNIGDRIQDRQKHLKEISRDVRQRKMSNDRIRQITTLLYCYKHFVESKGLLKYHSKELREVFFRRFDEHGDYYNSCEPVLTTFTFFKKVVDKWYSNSV